jgi:hypothetical protein
MMMEMKRLRLTTIPNQMPMLMVMTMNHHNNQPNGDLPVPGLLLPGYNRLLSADSPMSRIRRKRLALLMIKAWLWNIVTI